MKIRHNLIFVWQKCKQSGRISFKLWINKITTAKPEITPVGNWIHFPIFKLSVFIFRLSVVRIFPAEDIKDCLSCFSFSAYIKAVHIVLKACDPTINPWTGDELFLLISAEKKNGKKNEKTCFSLNWLKKGNKFLETTRVHGPDLGEWGRV